MIDEDPSSEPMADDVAVGEPVAEMSSGQSSH